jgi:hypothetical protein
MSHSSPTAGRRRRISFSRSLQRHPGNGVRAAAVHPGGIRTELDRHLDPSQVRKAIEQTNQQLPAQGKAPFQLKTIPQGAATSVWTAVCASADEIGGHYCENCHVGKVVPDDVPITASSEGVRGYALDPGLPRTENEKHRDCFDTRRFFVHPLSQDSVASSAASVSFQTCP